jgi:reductive dehalogenase
MQETDHIKSVDERITMFSRAELEPGSPRFKQYYRDHPEHIESDGKFRAQPGLLEPGSLFYDPLIFSSASATFNTVASLHEFTDGEVNPQPVAIDPVKITGFVKNWCLSQGAHSVGITILKPEHLYSTGGRRHNYGEPVENTHKLAIVFTVEMDYDRVRMAPRAPITLESSAQYLRAGTIAVNLAGFIRKLGYPARAHIDGRYQVRCPQIARDAGLGEIGRMSLLMTPGLGPRVRIAVVTTDMPMVCSKSAPDPSVNDFCRTCLKCAYNCPAGAITFSSKPAGQADWIMDQAACYTYWCKSGTDCGRCMAVCPYSHRSNLFHRIVRFLVKESRLFRISAVIMDDWFYGKRPRIRKKHDWM